jgi:hypothetical protein
MSHVVIRSVPFTTRLTQNGARDILARDRARAKKLLSGLHPHGPAAFHEARKRRHHGHDRHHGGSSGLPTQPASGGGSDAASDGSIDVTDAGMSSLRVYFLTDPYLSCRGYVHFICWCRLACYSVYASN